MVSNKYLTFVIFDFPVKCVTLPSSLKARCSESPRQPLSYSDKKGEYQAWGAFRAPQTYFSSPYCALSKMGLQVHCIVSIVDASTCKLCFTTYFYREWQSMPSTMPTSVLLALKWPKHCQWQKLRQYSMPFTVFKPPQIN